MGRKDRCGTGQRKDNMAVAKGEGADQPASQPSYQVYSLQHRKGKEKGKGKDTNSPKQHCSKS